MRDGPKMSFVASCRLHGTTRFFIERFSLTFDDAEVVMEADGRIPVFPTEAAARAEIGRRFPLPRGGPITESSSIEHLAGAMEDDYASKLKLFYDLDAARGWTKAPGPSGITPELALTVWELCWQVGDAPRPQRFDPMGMVGIHENMRREPAGERRDAYDVVLLGMKLSGIVHLAQEAGKPSEWGMEMPEMAELWPKTDFARLAGILDKGIDGFAKRTD